jgi:CspA family cold shock protein
MNFQDQLITDEDGRRWVFTVRMQRRLHEAGLPIEPDSLAELGDEPPAAYTSNDRDRNRDRDRDRDRDSGGRQSAPRQRQEDPLEPETIQIDPETGKYLGRLKWYNASRGYGFIARGGGEDIFFHKTDVNADVESLDEGQWVLYDVEETKKGLEANDIDVYEGTPE